MTDAAWIQLAAVAGLVSLMAYAVLGGADFGGGIWDLCAFGPRRGEQRAAIARAMGPVWEANHVWLIFLIVLLFTCFPRGYAALMTVLFVPLHGILLGIMLRGASFVFRGFARTGADSSYAPGAWGSIFGIASTATPFVLGWIFGVLTAGQVRLNNAGQAFLSETVPRWQLYPLGCGLLALSTCAYLAAVYLTVATSGQLREDFRRRALLAGMITALLAGVVFYLAKWEADWFFGELVSWRCLPIVGLGLTLLVGSAWSLFNGHLRWSRPLAAGQVVVMLLGWGVAHRDYLIYPDFTLLGSAAPLATIRFVVMSLPVGAALVAPSLWLLVKIFASSQR